MTSHPEVRGSNRRALGGLASIILGGAVAVGLGGCVSFEEELANGTITQEQYNAKKQQQYAEQTSMFGWGLMGWGAARDNPGAVVVGQSVAQNGAAQVGRSQQTVNVYNNQEARNREPVSENRPNDPYSQGLHLIIQYDQDRDYIPDKEKGSILDPVIIGYDSIISILFSKPNALGHKIALKVYNIKLDDFGKETRKEEQFSDNKLLSSEYVHSGNLFNLATWYAGKERLEMDQRNNNAMGPPLMQDKNGLMRKYFEIRDNADGMVYGRELVIDMTRSRVD